jgi:Amino acid permease
VLTGVLIVLVMRMLGEMAAAYPRAGSFTELIRRSLGDGAGFASGWLYWYFWVIVLGTPMGRTQYLRPSRDAQSAERRIRPGSRSLAWCAGSGSSPCCSVHRSHLQVAADPSDGLGAV